MLAYCHGGTAQAQPNCVCTNEGRQKSLTIDLKLILEAVVAPCIVLLAGALFRLSKKAPQTAATDVFALLIVLDIAILAELEAFSAKVSPHLKGDMKEIIGIAIFLACAPWAYCLLSLEDRLLAFHLKTRPVSSLRVILESTGLWLFVLSLVVVHVLVLTGRLG